MTAIRFPIDPVGTNSAPGLRVISAASDSRRSTDSSSPRVAQPRRAVRIASHMAGVGWVSASLRRSNSTDSRLVTARLSLVREGGDPGSGGVGEQEVVGAEAEELETLRPASEQVVDRSHWNPEHGTALQADRLCIADQALELF